MDAHASHCVKIGDRKEDEMKRNVVGALATAALVGAIACTGQTGGVAGGQTFAGGGSPVGAGGATDQGGTSGVTLTGGAGGNGGSAGIGPQCGSQKIQANLEPANFLIVLDRSCSMAWTTSSGQKKWVIVVAALQKLIKDYDGKLRFGLTMFPDHTSNACAQGTIPYPIGTSNQTLISMLQASLSSTDVNYPNDFCGVTNIDTAIAQAAGDSSLTSSNLQGYVLLVTDGAQWGCAAGVRDSNHADWLTADQTTTSVISNLRKNHGVKTFVVGFAGAGGFGGGLSAASLDPAALDAFADAGGEAVQNPADPSTQYYQAGDSTSLDAALSTIGAHTLGCVMKLQSTPPNPDKLYVFFNKTTPVPRDSSHASGWDYNAQNQTVTFYGSTCSELQSGSVTKVDIVFGCNQPLPS